MKRALGQKGFHERPGDHSFYVLHVDGKKTSVFTKFSRDGRDYAGGLLAQVRRQLGLNSEEFERLIACPMRPEEYIGLLRERRRIT